MSRRKCCCGIRRPTIPDPTPPPDPICLETADYPESINETFDGDCLNVPFWSFEYDRNDSPNVSNCDPSAALKDMNGDPLKDNYEGRWTPTAEKNFLRGFTTSGFTLSHPFHVDTLKLVENKLQVDAGYDIGFRRVGNESYDSTTGYGAFSFAPYNNLAGQFTLADRLENGINLNFSLNPDGNSIKQPLATAYWNCDINFTHVDENGNSQLIQDSFVVNVTELHNAFQNVSYSLTQTAYLGLHPTIQRPIIEGRVTLIFAGRTRYFDHRMMLPLCLRDCGLSFTSEAHQVNTGNLNTEPTGDQLSIENAIGFTGSYPDWSWCFGACDNFTWSS